HGTLKARRGARMAALTSGGAIPELGDFRVLAEPDNALVGTVNEDWAIESMAGDIFLLGTTSWRIKRVEPGIVRVEDAHGAPPSVPFWLGEAPGRTVELSQEVSSLRTAMASRLTAGEPPDGDVPVDQGAAVRWLMAECGIEAAAAETIAAYLGSAIAQLGLLPTMDTIVLERFFDEAGGMQLVGHTPFGARLNRALGLALRKRFCVTFDFELQAAASDDAILLSLGPQHSFPLERVPKFLASGTVEEVVRQAVLTSPMFAARWRWNLNTSLTVLRMRGGKKNPPAIQRMEADDLMAAVFPTLAACQENVAPGPMEIPDQVLVRQTLTDCLHEAMDIGGLKELVSGIEAGRVNVVVRDTTEPSVLAHEILNGRPFTFLDDAPLEERRSRAVPLRRGLPVQPHELARLDAAAIERVAEQVKPDPRDPDELHDVLMGLVAVRPEAAWADWFTALGDAGRVVRVAASAGELWAAVERLPEIEALYPGAVITPARAWRATKDPADEDAAAARLLRGHLECRGPSTVAALSEATGLAGTLIARGLAVLEQEGFAISGRFTGPDADEEYCARRLLARIHGYSRDRRRREIEPVTARDFMRFLLRWQHVAAGTKREGRFGLLSVIEQLQGFELAAGVWENAVLAARVDGYRREWLDELCLSGQVSWGRLSVKDPAAGALAGPEAGPFAGAAAGALAGTAETGGPAVRMAGPAAGLGGPAEIGGTAGVVGEAVRPGRPSRATPITLALRDDLSWLLRAARADLTPAEPGPGATLDVLDALRSRGALFRHDLVAATGRQPHEIDQALWDAVARGLVTADGFRAIRSLLRRGSRQAFPQPRGLRRGVRGTTGGASGRWSLLPSPVSSPDRDELAEAVAEQLAARWGVVFRDLVVRESLAVPWRDVLWAFRRMEARGTIRGGRFVTGFSGEQYAHPDAVDVLRGLRKQRPNGEQVTISATDPLNLTGVILPGPRIPAIASNRVTLTDGVVATAQDDGQPAMAATRASA
ncbi:MAG TPA: hypothetical protein VFW16_13485, partial [Streptosporangiaceae bacterium]|nr:hypothetical protein [Streptosporangiaceae bacterium]